MASVRRPFFLIVLPLLAWGCQPQSGFLAGPQPEPAILVPFATAPTSSKETPVVLPDAIEEAAGPFARLLPADRPVRSISLAECVALALEKGRTGALLDTPGSSQKTAVTGLTPLTTPTNASDSIRVFALDPSIAATGIEAALARYDSYAITDLFWNRINQPSRLLFP